MMFNEGGVKVKGAEWDSMGEILRVRTIISCFFGIFSLWIIKMKSPASAKNRKDRRSNGCGHGIFRLWQEIRPLGAKSALFSQPVVLCVTVNPLKKS